MNHILCDDVYREILLSITDGPTLINLICCSKQLAQIAKSIYFGRLYPDIYSKILLYIDDKQTLLNFVLCSKMFARISEKSIDIKKKQLIKPKRSYYSEWSIYDRPYNITPIADKLNYIIYAFYLQ